MAGDETPEREVIDLEWEVELLKHRTRDLLGMIEELKATDRSLNAKISRLKAEVRDEGEEDEETLLEEEEPRATLQAPDLHRLSVAELQRLFAR